MKNTVNLFGLLWITTPLLIGCASADDGISDAALAGDPEAMSRDDVKLNNRGAELVDDSESQLVGGRKQGRDGEAMIQNGIQRVANARSE